MAYIYSFIESQVKIFFRQEREGFTFISNKNRATW